MYILIFDIKNPSFYQLNPLKPQKPSIATASSSIATTVASIAPPPPPLSNHASTSPSFSRLDFIPVVLSFGFHLYSRRLHRSPASIALQPRFDVSIVLSSGLHPHCSLIWVSSTSVKYRRLIFISKDLVSSPSLSSHLSSVSSPLFSCQVRR
ncbi:hypothetical protein L6452_17944 [Arctium lappa]|uniref:Uncharacterized protein n=1 Tax=Arctium lappa TaxID=4217 RepID=A0ACB9C4S8_ARCLA|nr:hypothetical protein L6452_17944 [Arctium lappa]